MATSTSPRIFGAIILTALALLCPGRGFAQPQPAPDQPVVFLHGFSSSGDAWRETANRLAADLAITAHTPTVDWKNQYQSQAQEVQAQTSSVGDQPIAIGHSNGGIVARQWSRERALKGLATLGSPNAGAPFVDNALAWIGFNQDFYLLLSDLQLASFFATLDWGELINYGGGLSLAGLLPDASGAQIFQALGLRVGMPVFPQMASNSAYMRDVLNSPAAIAAEAQAMPNRVAIISYDPFYYYGGPYWIIDPDNAPFAAHVIEYSWTALTYGAEAIRLFSDPTDDTASDVADAMLSIAGWIRSFNDAWCYTISSPHRNECWMSDGLVPIWSQALPGASQGILFGGGPSHTRETSQSDAVLKLALTQSLSVSAREHDRSTPGGEPVDADPGGGSPEGVNGGDTLHPGQRLNTLVSADKRFEFVYQSDGNLVLYGPGGVALWSTGTGDHGEAVFQGDGNFVVYNSASHALWSSATVGRGDVLVVQNDGNVVIYDVSRSPVWSTGTAGYGTGGGGGGDSGDGENGGGGGTGSPDVCASADTHAHEGRCGEGDSCGHVFGSDTDCGCSNAPLVYDTCVQTVCDRTDQWVEDWCEVPALVCDWVWECRMNTDGFNAWEECGSYPENCREEPYNYVCGGHWDSSSGNCRDEAYECNPHQCGG
jgi:pimeloyl-ACP methyl ester carboxylesterase